MCFRKCIFLDGGMTGPPSLDLLGPLIGTGTICGLMGAGEYCHDRQKEAEHRICSLTHGEIADDALWSATKPPAENKTKQSCGHAPEMVAMCQLESSSLMSGWEKGKALGSGE